MRAMSIALVVGLWAAGAVAQPCTHFVENYGINQLNGRVQASVIFDDGTGPHLYVAGEFRNGDAAPGRQGIAMWNGSAYVPVGAGLDGSGFSMTVFDDDGAGPNPPALYVGGNFVHAAGQMANGIAKWDGHAWSNLGNGFNEIVFALKGFDDGNGPALYAGGSFSFAGTGSASSLAVWRNGDWTEVGGGIHLGGGSGIVDCLEVFQGALYVGGFYDHAGSVAANALAKWDGSTFSTLGAGVNYGGNSAQVSRLLAVDLSSTGGPSLIVAGTISNAGGVTSGPIARWTGSGWASMNSGAGSSTAYPNALGVYDDGSGAALYAGGVLTPGSGVSKWNGTSWQLVGAVPFNTGVPLGIDTMCVVPGSGTGKLFVGGMFKQIAGSPAPCAVFYQNNTWTPAGAFGLGFDARVNAMGVFDLGDGAHLYAAGSFRSAGGVVAAGVARLGASGWEAVATSMTPVNGTARCLAAYDDGSGMALYVGGAFTGINNVTVANVARWRPSSGWSAAGAGLSSLNTSTFGAVHALCVHDDDGPGPHTPGLFATGLIQYTGTAEVTNVVRWTGSTWASVGAGAGPNGTGGACLASIDLDGPGGQPPKLYFGGVLLPIASWDGAAWTEDAASPTATVISAIGGFDTGDGMKLYAGGDFTSPFQGSLARKTAGGWEQVGFSPQFPNGGGSGGVVENGSVQSMLMYDDGSGPALYMTGIFGSLAGTGYVNLARYNGGWSGVGAGLASRFPGPDGRGSALAVYNDGTGQALYIGGKFERFYPSSSETALNSWHATYNLARWGCVTIPPSTCCADFNGDGDERTDADIEAFFACLAGNCCATCCSPDYNGDGDERTDADIESFFRVLAGGNC